MKTQSFKTLILSLLTLLLSTQAGQSQQPEILQGLSLKLSPGIMSFYGDMSQNDYNPLKKLTDGSMFGIGFGIIKQIKPYFGIQAQFVAGSLYSQYEDPDIPANSTYFSGSLNDFSISARFDPIYLFRIKEPKWSPYISAGIATVGYRSARRNAETHNVILPTFGYLDDGVTRTARQIAMSVPMALGIAYQISPSFQLELEHSIRMTNTDVLDCLKGFSNVNDFYSLTTLGIRYTIGGIKNGTSVKEKPAQPVTEKPAEPVKQIDEGLIAKVPVTNLFVDCTVPETVIAGESFDVKIRLNKSNYRGEAKLIQKLNEGFIAEEIQSGMGIFSFFNQNVVIEWDQMPADSILSISYRVATAKTVAGSQTISGRLEYMQPEGLRIIRFNKTLFVTKPVEEPVQEQVAPVKVEEPVKVVAEPGKIQPSVGLTGIEFRVQCGAFRDSRQAPSLLAARYGIKETIQEEFVDGWYKYTVGSFRTYDDAVKFRDRFIQQTKILSAFIVAYKNGKRITVKEALR